MRSGLGLAQAFRTMTIIPVFGPDAKKASSQLYFYPLVGLFIGSLGCALLWLCTRYCVLKAPHAIVLGVLWACYMAAITRAFHLDGLGDMADGFFGGWTRERRLEIMKDSRVGSFGVVAISLCLLLKAACASVAIMDNEILSLLWACVVSRSLVVLMCCFSHYAKESGLSYDLVEGAGSSHAVLAIVQIALAGAALHLVFGMTMLKVAVPASASLLGMVTLVLVSRRRIGGVTGDVLGACCEICELLALVFCVFLN